MTITHNNILEQLNSNIATLITYIPILLIIVIKLLLYNINIYFLSLNDTILILHQYVGL